jgi:hypothetical protein
MTKSLFHLFILIFVYLNHTKWQTDVVESWIYRNLKQWFLEASNYRGIFPRNVNCGVDYQTSTLWFIYFYLFRFFVILNVLMVWLRTRLMLLEMVRIFIANDGSLCCYCETQLMLEMSWSLFATLYSFSIMDLWFLIGIFVYILGDVLVILDLHPDESLFEAGAAREVR